MRVKPPVRGHKLGSLVECATPAPIQVPSLCSPRSSVSNVLFPEILQGQGTVEGDTREHQ